MKLPPEVRRLREQATECSGRACQIEVASGLESGWLVAQRIHRELGGYGRDEHIPKEE